MKRKKVALVLSAGNAPGFSHIGVLTMLERFKIPIDLVVGCSMGALVGGIYCAGKLKEFRREILSRDKKQTYRLFIARPSIFGAVHHEKIERFLNKFIKNKIIEKLNKKYACVALDLVSGNKIVFREGDLIKAILASISIPGFFVPIKNGKHLIVDIGYFDPLPIDLAKQICPDCHIIAVDVHERKYNIKPGVIPNVFETFRRMLSIGQKMIVGEKGKVADILIKPKIKIGGFQYHRAEEAIMAGEEAVLLKIPQIKKQLGLN
jgi:NTE family protein